MVFSSYRFLLVLMLAGEGFSGEECFNSTGCTGSLVRVSSERECCVGTNDDLSFRDGVSCTNCIGFAFSK